MSDSGRDMTRAEYDAAPCDDRPWRCCSCGCEVGSELGLYDYEMAELAEAGELYCLGCTTRCDLCGRRLPNDVVLRIGDTAVCEDCREEYTP